MKVMKQNILNYRVIVKPDERIGSKKACYVALCPTLGVADDGATIQEALKNIKKTIIFHIECLEEERKDIPVDNPNTELVTTAQVTFTSSPSTRFAF